MQEDAGDDGQAASDDDEKWRRVARMVGPRIKALREARGWSLRTLGKRAGVVWTFLGQVERGERLANLVLILRLSRAFGIDAGELLRGLPVDRTPPPR